MDYILKSLNGQEQLEKDADLDFRALIVSLKENRPKFSDRAGYGAPHQFGTAYYESFPEQKAANGK